MIGAYNHRGLEAYRLTGLQAYRLTGLQAYRLTGLQAYRLTGFPLEEYKGINTMPNVVDSDYLERIKWTDIRTQASFGLPCALCGSTENTEMHQTPLHNHRGLQASRRGRRMTSEFEVIF
jgi:hypothetical protein